MILALFCRRSRFRWTRRPERVGVHAELLGRGREQPHQRVDSVRLGVQADLRTAAAAHVEGALEELAQRIDALEASLAESEGEAGIPLGLAEAGDLQLLNALEDDRGGASGTKLTARRRLAARLGCLRRRALRRDRGHERRGARWLPVGRAPVWRRGSERGLCDVGPVGQLPPPVRAAQGEVGQPGAVLRAEQQADVRVGCRAFGEVGSPPKLSSFR
jgi:hypothetical protein